MTFTLLPSAWYSLTRSIRVTLERKYSMFFFFFFFYKQIAYFKCHCIFWKRQSFQCITCVYIFRQEMVAFMTSLTNYFINTHFLFTPLQKKTTKNKPPPPNQKHNLVYLNAYLTTRRWIFLAEICSTVCEICFFSLTFLPCTDILSS